MIRLKIWLARFFCSLLSSEHKNIVPTMSRPTDLPESLSESTEKSKIVRTQFPNVPTILVDDDLNHVRTMLSKRMLNRRNSKRFVIGEDDSAATTPESPMSDMLPKVDSDLNLHVSKEWLTRARRLKVGDSMT
ncbi:hypothetical protein WA026_002685, partial [Henosepilachna vigintioctopunctata]